VEPWAKILRGISGVETTSWDQARFKVYLSVKVSASFAKYLKLHGNTLTYLRDAFLSIDASELVIEHSLIRRTFRHQECRCWVRETHYTGSKVVF